MTEALTNLLQWLEQTIVDPISQAYSNAGRWLDPLIDRLNDLINNLLVMFNNKPAGEVIYINDYIFACIIALIVAYVAIKLIINTIKSIIQLIGGWISGDTIIITNVRERRKRKNKRG